jgi:hypothetical protein
MKLDFRLLRDPVVMWNLLAVVAMGVGRVAWHFGDQQQAVLDGVSVALANFIAAARTHDGQLPALTGLFKAFFALVIGLGMHLNPNIQLGAMTLLTYVGSLWVRMQVAPVNQPTPAALAEPVVEVNNVVGAVTSTPGGTR